MVGMGLSNAEKQRRWRERRNALARGHPEVVEGALLREVERTKRGELSEVERIALADRLADTAMRHLWRAHALNEISKKVRAGER
jgi:hypothetical protein